MANAPTRRPGFEQVAGGHRAVGGAFPPGTGAQPMGAVTALTLLLGAAFVWALVKG